MIILIILYFFYIQGELVVFFFLEIQKLTIRWKDHWWIDDGLKCTHPFTWGCCVDLI